MPTYEYACSSCQNEWEEEQSIKDAPLTECPRCLKATAKRQISRGTGFILKGGGWYSDLYSSSSNKSGESNKDSSKPSGSTGDSAGSSSGSSEGSSSGGSSGSTPAASSSGSSSGGSSAAA